MTSPSRNELAEETPDRHVEVTGLAPVTSQAKSRKKALIIGAVLLVGLCLCVGFGVVTSDASPFRVAAQRRDIGTVIDAFMRAMANKDAGQAQALFSARAKKQTTRSAIEKIFESNDFVLFYGYMNVEVASLYIGPVVSTNPDAPQGIIARVSGRLAYEGGYRGSFQATLEKEGNEWRLHGIQVTVPPEKINDYLKTIRL